MIAQGLVDFPYGMFHWQVAGGSSPAAGADPTGPELGRPATFVFADDGVVYVTGTGVVVPPRSGGAVMLPALSGVVLSTAGARRC